MPYIILPSDLADVAAADIEHGPLRSLLIQFNAQVISVLGFACGTE
jgi:hypothetical protein